jgi:flavocytochrome c
MKDMLAAGLDLNHPRLVEAMIRESNNTVEWTVSELGVSYRERLTQLRGHSVPRTLSTENASGSDIINPMLARVEALRNIELVLNTRMDSFIMDENNKHVKGIRVKPTDEEEGDTIKNIYCDMGVILAAGGFSADVEFRSIQNPSFHEGVMSTNQPGATAEVLKEALKIGAMSVQLSRIQLGPWTSPDETGFGVAPFFCIGAGFPYGMYYVHDDAFVLLSFCSHMVTFAPFSCFVGIIVDPETSKRFVNELGNRYERSMAIIKLGHPVLCITDSQGAKHSLRKDLSILKPVVMELNTVKDIAESYGMDFGRLKETIDNYNKGVKRGEDAFGKSLREDLHPIQEPPFYTVRLWPKVHHCMGGLHINEHAQVMHVDGVPIEGLYAAGEIAGGVHGADRLGSCATLDCLAFGRIAGRSAVRLAHKVD